MLYIGILHLLLHLGRVGINLGADACLACLGNDGQGVFHLGLAEVNEEQLCGGAHLLGIEVQLVEHVVDTVGTETDAHTTQARHAEDACKVVIAAATCDAAYLHIQSLHLEDAARVVVQATCQGEVQFDGVVKRADVLQDREHELHLLHALQASLALCQHLAHGL